MKQCINPQITKFISSRQMASSEIQECIINLGKALVEELGLDQSVDTPARWMAHYIAEQMTFAENAQGDASISAEKKCFETILKLWQHRSSLPDGRRPFESFEPIFRVLEQLNPENKQPFYFENPETSAEKDEAPKQTDSVQQWLDMALDIDQIVRIWLDYVFKQAALCAKDEKTLKWLENSIAFPDNNAEPTIIYLLYEKNVDLEVKADEIEKDRKIQLIKDRIKKLEVFSDFNQKLLEIMKEELDNIS